MNLTALDGIHNEIKPKQEMGEESILKECASQLNKLFNFETLAFMLIDSRDQSFYLRHCNPAFHADYIQSEVDLLIEKGVFAWVLSQNKPIFEKTQNNKTLILHSLSTRSRIRGMFIGLCDNKEALAKTNLFDFLSVILFSTSNMLENHDLYQYIRDQNEHLEETIKQRTAELETARKAAEAANEAKTQFLANISHEIRTPLTSILGYADLMRHNQLTPKEQERAVKNILQVTAHLSGIINNILDISKIEANKLEIEFIPTQVFPLLNSVATIIQNKAEEKGLEFAINYCFPLPDTINTDPTRLKQILLNLCNNAIKFTESGRVTVEISYLAKQKRMNFAVIDTGIGINKDIQGRLFEKFVQADSSISRNYGGSGLGLTISKELAQKLGGDIVLDSTPGQGCRFEFSIDTGRVDSTSLLYSLTDLPEKEESNAPWSVNRRLQGDILLAEDNLSSQQLISLFLNKAGIAVDTADNGNQVVELALKNDYDIILMDLHMPGLNGFEATTLLRNIGYAGTIIALTANATVDIKQKCHDIGFDDFLSKPIETEVFFESLSRFLRTSDAPASTSLLDDPDFRQILNEFIEYLPTAFEDMTQAFQQNEWERLKSLAHRLKGVAGAYGFPEISETAAIIESDICAENLTDIADLIQQLHTGFKKRLP